MSRARHDEREERCDGRSRSWPVHPASVGSRTADATARASDRRRTRPVRRSAESPRRALGQAAEGHRPRPGHDGVRPSAAGERRDVTGPGQVRVRARRAAVRSDVYVPAPPRGQRAASGTTCGSTEETAYESTSLSTRDVDRTDAVRRALVIYGVLLVLFRFTGKRSLGDITTLTR